MLGVIIKHSSRHQVIAVEIMGACTNMCSGTKQVKASNTLGRLEEEANLQCLCRTGPAKKTKPSAR